MLIQENYVKIFDQFYCIIKSELLEHGKKFQTIGSKTSTPIAPWTTGGILTSISDENSGRIGLKDQHP
jgi:hypothetical protein